MADVVPGVGTYFVGIDIAPGRYRCAEARGGWWVRFAGAGGGEPVGSWPLPAGPAEVEISPTDFAFETHVASEWRRIGAPRGAPARAADGEVRPVADPALRPELDRLVRRRRPARWAEALTLLIAGLGASSVLGHLWVVPILLFGVIAWTVLTGVAPNARRARELRRRRDRYVLPEDLDAPARDLLARVQRAIDTVEESMVNREGLLDSIDNAVTLPRQEWEIAQVLARQSRLRARDAERAGDEVPEVEAALRPLRAKLELSVRAVTRRVEALERYAERAVAADEALRAQRRLEELTRDAHEYDALLADSARDELAVPAIERLTEQGDALVRALRERLAAAAEAGGDLPPPGPAPEPPGD